MKANIISQQGQQHEAQKHGAHVEQKAQADQKIKFEDSRERVKNFNR